MDTEEAVKFMMDAKETDELIKVAGETAESIQKCRDRIVKGNILKRLKRSFEGVRATVHLILGVMSALACVFIVLIITRNVDSISHDWNFIVSVGSLIAAIIATFVTVMVYNFRETSKIVSETPKLRFTYELDKKILNSDKAHIFMNHVTETCYLAYGIEIENIDVIVLGDTNMLVFTFR